MVDEQLSKNSQNVKEFKKLLVKGVIAIEIAIILFLYPLISISLISNNLLLYLIVFFLIINVVLFFNQDAIVKLCGAISLILFLYIVSVLVPLVYFKSFLPTTFDLYYILLLILLAVLFVRHFSIITYKKAKNMFLIKQKYLEDGFIYIGNKKKLNPIPYYSGDKKTKYLKVVYDFICVFGIICVLYRWFVIEPGFDTKLYLAVCSELAFSILMTCLVSILLSAFICFCLAKKRISKKFYFVSNK